MSIFKVLSAKKAMFLMGFLVASSLAALVGRANFSFAVGGPAPVRIMVVGDSISHGASGDWTWRYRLWQHLQTQDNLTVDFVGPKQTVIDPTATTWTENFLYNDPNFDYDHDATAGRQIADEKTTIAGEVYSKIRYIPNVTTTTDVLLINMGTNDLSFTSKTAQQIRGEMDQLIDNARINNSRLKIVLSKLAPTAHPADYQTRRNEFNNLLDDLIAKKSTSESPIVIADPTPGFDPTPGADTFDGVHPTPRGEYKFAKAFADALSSNYGIGNSYGDLPTEIPAWPLAPTNFAVLPANNAVTLNWTKAPGVSDYYVYYRNVTAGEQNFTPLPSTVTGTSYTFSSLVNGQTYEFAVSSKRGYVEGPKTPLLMATPSIAPSVSAFSGAIISQGTAYNRTVSFTDPDSTSWIATVDYGDGSTVETSTLTDKTFELSHVYTTAGSFTVTVTVKDSQYGALVTRNANVTVAPLGSVHTLSPDRILDTRTNTGGHPAVLNTGESMDLQVLGAGGVPTSGVSAVIVNVAVVPGSNTGFLSLYPSGVARPSASTINFVAGVVVSNQALVRVGQNGKITIFNNLGSNHVIVDVQGWVGTEWEPADGKVASFSPMRVLDTRTTQGGHYGALGTGQTITLAPLTELASQGVEMSKVKAIVANVVGVPSSTASGFITAYPSGTTMPVVSTVSIGTAGVAVANLAVIPVGADGKIAIYNHVGPMDVVVDVQAVVFEDSGVDSNGQPRLPVDVQPVPPARILDTRTTLGGQNGAPIGSGATINLPVLGVGGMPPSGVSAVILHVTVTSPSAGSFLAVYPKGIARPNVSTLNFSAGKTVSNNVIVPVGTDGSISLYNNYGTAHAIVDVQGWVAATP